MKIAGSYVFPASREEVWAAVNDPEVLARSIPGCQRLEQVGEHEFESTLKVGLQAVKGVYNGRVRIDDLQPPHHYRINVDGKGTNGFMQGAGTIDLEEEGEGTRLTYAGDAQVGGTIASVGQRLIEGAAKTLISQSLKALAAQIEGRKKGGSGGGGKSTADVIDTPGLNDDAAAAAPKSTSGADDERRSNEYAKKAVATMESQEGRAIASETAAGGSPRSDEQAGATTAPAQGATPPPATTTQLSTHPLPPSPTTVAPTNEGEAAGFQRRSIVVPEHEQLSEGAVLQGMVADLINERPWLPWVIVAFLLGYLFGRRG